MSTSDTKVAGAVLGCVGGLALIFAIWAFIVWIASLLWNGILVPTFGFPPLTFLQMWGIIVLINLLFGGLRASTSSSK